MPFTIENGVLTQYTEEPGVTEVSIPDGVTVIGKKAFYECKTITDVTMPESVTVIDNEAFYACGSLLSVTVSPNVRKIGDLAFSDCFHLKAIAVPDSVQAIGTHAFLRCKSLESVKIGKGLAYCVVDAFQSCESLLSFDVDADNPYFCSIDGCLCSKDGKTLLHYPIGKKPFVLPDNVKKIERNAFADGRLITKNNDTIPADLLNGMSVDFGDYACNDVLDTVIVPVFKGLPAVEKNLRGITGPSYRRHLLNHHGHICQPHEYNLLLSNEIHVDTYLGVPVTNQELENEIADALSDLIARIIQDNVRPINRYDTDAERADAEEDLSDFEDFYSCNNRFALEDEISNIRRTLLINKNTDAPTDVVFPDRDYGPYNDIANRIKRKINNRIGYSRIRLGEYRPDTKQIVLFVDAVKQYCSQTATNFADEIFYVFAHEYIHLILHTTALDFPSTNHAAVVKESLASFFEWYCGHTDLERSWELHEIENDPCCGARYVKATFHENGIYPPYGFFRHLLYTSFDDFERAYEELALCAQIENGL